jgi:transposase
VLGVHKQKLCFYAGGFIKFSPAVEAPLRRHRSATAHVRSSRSKFEVLTLSTFSIDITNCAVVVTLKSPHGGKTSTEIAEKLGIPVRTINSIYARAIEKGFESNHLQFTPKDKWLKDAPRSGKSTKQTKETKAAVIEQIRTDCYEQEKSCAAIAGDVSKNGVNILSITVWRILRKV